MLARMLCVAAFVLSECHMAAASVEGGVLYWCDISWLCHVRTVEVCCCDGHMLAVGVDGLGFLWCVCVCA